jgi:predicted transcriptional regulator
MATPRVQSFASLRAEMIAVARGEREAPRHAAEPSVHSADLIARLLTPENRALMAVIRDQHPTSVAHLAQLTSRAPSNLTRTLDKFEAAGLISFKGEGRRKVPISMVGTIHIEMDPFSQHDTVRIMQGAATKLVKRKVAGTHRRAGKLAVGKLAVGKRAIGKRTKAVAASSRPARKPAHS